MKKSLFILALIVFGVWSVPCPAAEKKIHIAHWNVPNEANTKVLQLIGKEIEEASGGTIKTEVSWQAFGKPGDYYDALVHGLCDIACFGPTYSPGRFPITEMMTLPIHYPNNRTVVMAYYQLWKKGFLKKEFEKFVPLALGNNASFMFMWRKNSVENLASLKGLKVAAPYTIHTKIVQRAGGTPVSLPVTEVYSALDTGVIDGTWQIWPAIPIFRLHEVLKHVTDVSMSCGPYVIAANRNSYKKFPEKVQKMLSENMERYSMMMSDGFQEVTDLGKKMFLESGGKINTLSAEETAQLDQMLQPIFQEWVQSAKDRGLPAVEALKELHSTLVGLGVQNPFTR